MEWGGVAWPYFKRRFEQTLEATELCSYLKSVLGRENSHYKRLDAEYFWLFVQGAGRKLVQLKRE